MKKHILFLGLCLSLSLSAKSVSDYKVGEELSDKEGVKYFKELSKRPVQEWPNKNLSINDVPKGKQGDYPLWHRAFKQDRKYSRTL